MKGEREIPARAARSLWCQGMLMDIVYVVSSEDHFWVVWVVSESEYLVTLLGLSAGDE